MSHASRLLLLSCLTWAVACTVPTLDELETERPAGCNADHKCPEDSVCFENRCIRTEGLACTPGTTELCGTDEGTCSKGTRLCGADGTLGACTGEVKPVFEVCDGEDNDCDGRVDHWAPINLARNMDPGTSLAAIPVNREAVSKPNTVLIATTESSSIVTRTFLADGTLSPGETFSPATLNDSYQSPALAADGDTVAVAWIQQTFGGRNPPKVYVALLDGSGKKLLQPLELPYTNGTTSLNDPTKLELAINPTHILVLVTTTGGGTTLSSEVWAVTVTRGLEPKTVSTPVLLTAPKSDFGLHATANGKSNGFLVAFDKEAGQYVGVISNGGTLVGTPVLATRGSFNHSPFVVPEQDTSTGFTLYFVRNNSDPLTSEIVSVTCTAEPTAACLADTRLHSQSGTIQRMQLAPRPGVLVPGLALLVLKESVGETRAFFAATLAPKGLEQIKGLAVPHDAAFAETLVHMPDFSHYLLYQHSVSSLAATPGIITSEAHLLPFCGP